MSHSRRSHSAKSKKKAGLRKATAKAVRLAREERQEDKGLRSMGPKPGRRSDARDA